MSATGRSAAALTGHVRHPDDFYSTPSWCTRAVLPTLGLRPNSRVLEPASGEGAIACELVQFEKRIQLTAVEIDAQRWRVLTTVIGSAHCHDFLTWKNRAKFDVIVTNPPFALAMEFVEASMARLATNGSCAMLLRLNWLASLKRAAFLREHCPDVYVLPRRPSFTGGGTDATDYGWFVWRGTSVRRQGEVRVLELEALERIRRVR